MSDRSNKQPWTRREVLGAATGVVSLAVLGCAGKLPPAREVKPEGGAVTIALADAPQLAEPGGVLTLDVEGIKKPILVVRDGDTHRALLLECTHMGCTPGWNAEQRSLDCPCHGSRFRDTGEVIKGPAKAALKVFAVASDGQTITFRPEA